MTRIGNTYRWFHGRFTNRPTNFSWIIEKKLAGSGMPVNLPQLSWVTKNGIRSVITVRETPLPASWLANNGQKLEYMHLRVDDFCAPSLENLESAVRHIDQHIKEKKPVLVHCAAGKGRTGTLLAAYMMLQDPNLTSLEAINKIRVMRPGSVQSDEQIAALQSYEMHLKKRLE
ncbi:MAG TPA: dual specificity protein phosphatase family protein [Nitrososphaeraceae archaeon]|nr:dual specificity protein phosphatase family protein [Nitrososphaeraceae archaeon]